MKPISTAFQGRIMYVPIMNILTIFFVLYNCLALHPTTRTWVKVYRYLFGYAIPPAIFWMIIAQLFPVLSGICSVATMYITPIFMSYGLIRFQQKYLNI